MKFTNFAEPETPEIINLNYYSLGFPSKKWEDLIRRDNYIDSICSIFEEGEDVLFISGNRGIGKTTLLAQFCKEKAKTAISVFFNQFHNLELNIDYLRTNIANQIKFILDPSIVISTDKYISADEYRFALLNLKKKYKNSREPIYLVIDGLEDRGKIHKEVIKKICQELPIGEDHIKILITGELSEFSSFFEKYKLLNMKELPIIGFDNHQVKLFLEDLYSQIEDNKSILKVTKSYPSRLEVLKRLLLKEIEIEEILNSKNYKIWLELDTNSININDSINGVILSLIALNDRYFTLDEIVDIIGEEKQTIEKKIANLDVLELNNEKVQFISKDYSDYFSNILRANRRKCTELLIKYYASSEKLNDKFELSKIYSDQKKWFKVLDLIDSQFLADSVESTGSKEIVNKSIDLGVTSSEELKFYDKIFKYSFEGSLINELDNYLFWESEILARISLNDFAGAIRLAEKAVLKIDRLRLLRTYSKETTYGDSFKEYIEYNNGNPPEEFLDLDRPLLQTYYI